MPVRCALGCERRGVHRFPSRRRFPEQFKAWVNIMGEKLQNPEDHVAYTNKRICSIHFTENDHNRNNRLNAKAIPSRHLPSWCVIPQPVESSALASCNVQAISSIDSSDKSQLQAATDEPTSPEEHEDDGDEPMSIFHNQEHIDINKSTAKKCTDATVWISSDELTRELSLANTTEESVTLKEYGSSATRRSPAKEVLQLRLINDSVLDEPIYEVLTDDTTDVVYRDDITTQDTEICSPHKEKDLSFKEIDKSFKEKETEETHTPQSKETDLTEKDMSYWKMKLIYVLNNTQFCGICLDADVDMNTINDDFEIIDNERTRRTTLRDIAENVFKEKIHISNSQICNNCTDKLIQSYIFIQNAKETLKTLNYHIDEMFNKTCYIRNNVLKDSEHGNSKIHNVVIELTNKEFAENFDNNKSITAEMEPEQSKQDHHRHRQTLKCVSCNMVLPSYRAWKIHERTSHKQNYRCRICLQSYKTLQDLSTHYKMHLRSRCTFCHKIVQDGELLHHLKTRHKRLIHLCAICNVAFYSAKALGSHIHKCHYRDYSKCVTCLKSLSQVELESHQCRFKCPECVEAPCVHHKYLMCYREHMMNLVPRAKCLDCRYVCTSKEALIAHVNRQHLNLQPHSCQRCGHRFYCKSDLNKHTCTSENVNKYIHICQYCDKEFSNLYFCKRHEKSCKCIQRKYQCDDCPANFDSSKDQMKHRTLKHGKDILSCSLCDRVFLNDLKRKRHERQAHGNQKQRVILDCVVCQAKFSSKAALELHMRYHGPDAKYRFNTLQQAHKHRRSFAVCEVCGKVISRILFKRHIITHSDATVSCKTCGKPFQNVTLLRCHQKVHLQSVPCPRCKKLIISAKLWRHFRNHLIRESLDFKVAAIHGLV